MTVVCHAHPTRDGRVQLAGVDANGHTIAVTLDPLDAVTAGAELTTAGLRAAAHHPTHDTRDPFDITEADRDVS